jgi:Ca-activated chloride channel family protein
VIASLAEWLHSRRVRPLRRLVFGPRGRPTFWVAAAAPLRAAAMTAVAWGATTLFLIEPTVHRGARAIEPDRIRHVVLVLDVSPSMKLADAGPELKLPRTKRASELMTSFFKRVPMEQVRLSVIATYNGAKPVVIDTRDVNVVRNILEDLPLSHAFDSGKTKLFDGLNEAARVARAWPRSSTTVVVISDGDTVPATGTPEMPPSVREIILVGVGDPRSGSFIDGHVSRQDAATLRQIAARLRGVYHDGNQHHLPTALLNEITRTESERVFEKLTRREYALMACAAGAITLATLPIALMLFGTAWQPGVRTFRTLPAPSPAPAQ